MSFIATVSTRIGLLVFNVEPHLVFRFFVSVSVENVLCDGKNRRLRLLNFGNALDLDPPRVGLDNDDLTTHGPGSIASSLAADVFSVSVIVFQILFGVSGDAMKEQLKDAGYELDAWLKKAVKDSIITIDSPGFEYLKERRGMWRMLKAMVRPNPMRKVSLGNYMA